MGMYIENIQWIISFIFVAKHDEKGTKQLKRDLHINASP